MAHLVHGLQSFWRTLGLRHEKYNNFLNRGSVLLGVVLALGFLSIPASIFFGIIQ
jgi:succinate dehydrogenase / fumarate reductase cytochrome b subunit